MGIACEQGRETTASKETTTCDREEVQGIAIVFCRAGVGTG